MHRIKSRTYVGQPGEVASVTTEVHSGGQVSLELDDVTFSGGQFPLPDQPGGQRTLTVTLVGPVGASCVVRISEVDGGADGDFLMIDDAGSLPPSNNYRFYTATSDAVKSLGLVREGGAPGRAAGATRTREASATKRGRH